jgi:hypothetical protein
LPTFYFEGGIYFCRQTVGSRIFLASVLGMRGVFFLLFGLRKEEKKSKVDLILEKRSNKTKIETFVEN